MAATLCPETRGLPRRQLGRHAVPKASKDNERSYVGGEVLPKEIGTKDEYTLVSGRLII